MAKYNVHFLVDGQNLPTVLEVTNKVCKLVSVSPVEEPEKEVAPEQPRKTFQYANGMRLKGISGDDLLLEFCKTHPQFNAPEIEDEFVKRGFARTTAGPVLARAVNNGVLRRTGHGTYQRKVAPPTSA